MLLPIPRSHGKGNGVCLSNMGCGSGLWLQPVETLSRKYMLDIINKTNSTKTGWDGVNFLEQLVWCSVLWPRHCW